MPRTRRNFSAEFKAKVVLEILEGSKSVGEACREYSLKPDLVSRWKAQFLAKAAQVFESGEAVDPQQARIEELERLAGKLSLEPEVAKKVLTLLPRAKAGNESCAASWPVNIQKPWYAGCGVWRAAG